MRWTVLVGGLFGGGPLCGGPFKLTWTSSGTAGTRLSGGVGTRLLKVGVEHLSLGFAGNSVLGNGLGTRLFGRARTPVLLKRLEALA